jgi:hypothetical protein
MMKDQKLVRAKDDFCTELLEFLAGVGRQVVAGNGAQGRDRTTDTAIFRHVFNQLHQTLSQTTNGKPVEEAMELENRRPGTVPPKDGTRTKA